MENRDVGFSIERRRFLAETFKIPPLLLGIVTLEKISQQLSGLSPQASGNAQAVQKTSVDVDQYRHELQQYWELNHADTVKEVFGTIPYKLTALRQALSQCSRGREEILLLLCDYHQFVANFLRDQGLFDESAKHLTKALQRIESMDEKQFRELRALIYHRMTITLQEQGRLEHALVACKKARKESNTLPPALVGAILLEEGHILAKLVQNEKDKTKALQTIEEAGKIIRSGQAKDDPFFLKLNMDRYHLTRGSALVAMQWNQDALYELGEVRGKQKRRQAYTNILQAQALLNQKLYTPAIELAIEGLVVAREIHSLINVQRVQNIYKQLKTSDFKDNPEVARLHFLLNYT
ncbi:hypothetical protein EI42_06345 [Thermosporothrix hazakensis]|jgi:tetratricopeptide (TPR) repeat protein|uniref:MalT-like TPR region domain-containing protein n=1 Tax=Thermosporothrix hazakensis TaxID=644383 RepID=A0A326TQK2_THEHA|nr:hypothetical protein [Thermosporothrix hazakensis]PZW18119.1 hypothetical protein EI42_06345 [Thermosporothrix hazakensis]GCE50621.1 hypothetical protein KTH_54900 [Thermosporothrix hazakensis]